MFEKRLVKTAFAVTLLISIASCNILSQSLSSNGPIAEAKTRKKVVAEAKLRNDIIEFAQDYVGSKYRPAGKSPTTGFDCSGFVHFVMQKYAIEMAPSSASQEKQGLKISMRDAQPGDLVFFRRTKDGRVFHVALIVDNDDGDLTIIHSTSRGVVIDRIQDSAYWRSKVMTLRNVVSGP